MIPATYTTAEVAASLRCHVNTVRRLARRGVVQPIRLGEGKQAEYRFTQADVDALFEALRPVQTRPTPRRRGRVA